MRPDMAFAAHLTRFLNKPSLVLLQAAKRVLRYLRGTEDVVITYWRNFAAHWTVYLEADYASCKDDRKSVTGYFFSYGSGANSWSAKKQTCVVTSPKKAEVHPVSEAFKDHFTYRDPGVLWINETNNHSQRHPIVSGTGLEGRW